MNNKISWIFIALLAGFAGAGYLLVLAPDIVITTFVFVLLGWIISLCLHEYAHAVTASRFGDTSVAESGYLTLDPRRYFAGAQSLILPVIALVLGGVALPGGAVMIREDLIARRWQRSAVALAGPISTLVCAGLVYAAAVMVMGPTPLFEALMVLFFFLLMAFIINMLPIPGLDGFAAISAFLPDRVRNAVPPRIGGLVMVGLLLVVFFFGYRVIMPVMAAITGMMGIDLSPISAGFARFRFW